MTSELTPATAAPSRLDAIHGAIAARDRRRAVALMRAYLEDGPASGDVWRQVSRLAVDLGELSLSREAARRFAATRPDDMDYVFFYAMVLSRDGLLGEALQQLDALPPQVQTHPALLHFRAVTATQQGGFATAERLLRQALAISPAPIQWQALSVAKKFTAGDPDIAHMEAVLPRVANAPSAVKAQLLYALGKAYDDAGQSDKAPQAYATGAELMRRASGGANSREWNEFVSRLLATYTPENLQRLRPSGAASDRVFFVTGFPRSGTTLVEQILASHSQVADGAELNLLPVALMPVGDPMFDAAMAARAPEASGHFSFDDALAYQTRSQSPDPWGDIGRDYLHMVDDRFGGHGRVVDKTLNLGIYMGLLLHSLPNARMFWLRRRPEDCALSNYRLYSPAGTLPWTYSATDIAEFFKAEDKLYAHWTQMFPDRIMTVPYEELVSDPQTWIRRILAHAGLPEEPQVFEPHKSTRAVTTASMAQVRSPISTARIGTAEAYKDFTEEFRRAYYGRA